ncbi:hypothetical protein CC86DRAFT_360193 [Ophiobolus disseminans]|uniref:Uncharacterized protein n=1 Tax=Ophiobolus disseminans TaxID=1469910 RepID=A0A6A6ZHZ2_9PLEO|nr:hypothetical protein CC86DRAFT_360193 [Ophiobolus disseminans]
MDGEDALVDVQCFAQYALDPPVETFYARQRDNADIHRQDRLDRLRPQAPDRIKQDLLARIRWNFSKSVDDVEIEDGLDEDGTERRQPFFSDPTAAESLAEPPISSVLINSADIIKYKASVYAPDGYRYHGKLLENENAQSITIKDFVVAAHAHIYEYLGTIVDYRRDMRLDSDSGIVEQELIDEPDVLFKAAACYAVAHETAGTISTFITNEDSMTIEAFWESRRSDAVTLRELRDAYRADRAMN